jgi:uncharacterized alkaline shock family protein YloU
MKPLRYVSGFILLALALAGLLFILSQVLRGDAAWAALLDVLRVRKLEVLFGCLAGIFLIAIYALAGIRARDPVKYLSYDIEGGGSVSISLKAMQEFIARLTDEFAQVVSLEPDLKPVNGGVDVQLDVKVKAGAQIPELCRMLQDRTRECIKQNVGLSEVREVRVRVQEIVVGSPAADTVSPESRDL